MIPAHEIIKDKRLENELSQKALAEKIGVTQQAIALLESGKRKVDFDLFCRIMEVLDVPLVEIFRNTEIAESNIEDNLSLMVTSQTDKAFENILKANGAKITFHSAPQGGTEIEIKFNGKVTKIPFSDYLRLKDDIFDYIEYAITRIMQR